ncbi:pyrimidine reductase family protein [Actinokineospora sp. PR83]|uniref:pyrimidine reductase family protein n=1 Tax=Actinokineospora sp. PR83 TaxID=2884908 RepID=UPI0027E0296E|nr:pyrimidine reductase family protein [Actinokineospora sp. PR83]MCG8919338.1 pyrimidine reductase family protein [Actinokineospora sp. PR83]
MHRLWPTSPDGSPTVVDDTALERLYDYPEDLDRPWVQVNFVTSADGAVAVDGHSAGLSGPADKKVFALGRDFADVVLVGWGTARDEGYRGLKRTETRTDRRLRRGLAELPPIAVVTPRCSVPPDSPLLTDTTVPPIVITTGASAAADRAALAEAGADVVVAGERELDPVAALAALDERGLRRVCCEGGPRLFGDLIAADLVDQLCLTVAPLLAGGGVDRIAGGGPVPVPRRLALASVLSDDGFLMLRYRRGN